MPQATQNGGLSRAVIQLATRVDGESLPSAQPARLHVYTACHPQMKRPVMPMTACPPELMLMLGCAYPYTIITINGAWLLEPYSFSALAPIADFARACRRARHLAAEHRSAKSGQAELGCSSTRPLALASILWLVPTATRCRARFTIQFR
jgi:hypothetical protein